MEALSAGHDEVQGFELSAQQKRLWELRAGRTARATCVIGIEGELDESLLKRAVNRVVERHEILRTTFQTLPGVYYPLQEIGAEACVSWDEPGREPHAGEWSVKRASENLARARAESGGGAKGAATLQLSLVSPSPSRRILSLGLKSLCVDFVTLQNLYREIADEYLALAEGTEGAGSEPVQYADYAGWQGTLLEEAGQGAAGALAHWQSRTPFSLPTQLLRTGGPAQEGTVEADTLAVEDGAEAAPNIQALCAKYGATERAFLLASWLVLLRRLTGEQRIVVGVEFDGRTSPELEGATGLFARWLPFTLTLDASASFEDVLGEVSGQERQAARWQDYFGLESTAGDGRQTASENSFTAAFEFHEPTGGRSGRRVAFSLLDYEVGGEPFELKLSCRRVGKQVAWKIHFDAALYTLEDCRRITGCFRELIRDAADRPARRIGVLNVLSAEARREVVVEWNRTARDFPYADCLQELFEAAAARHPERIALICQQRSWTYAELNRAANKLAHHLRSLGAGPERLVGLLFEHSGELIVAALAVLKSGAAFVPLNPDLPADRLRLLVERAALPLVVSTTRLAGESGGLQTRFVLLDSHGQRIEKESDANPPRATLPGNLAYVIYTSGSTGGPKGVLIEHRSVCNLAFALDDAVYRGAEQLARVSLNGPLSFDTSIKQLAQLCFGRSLCVIPPELKGIGAEMLGYLAEHEIDLLDCTPSHLRLLIEAGMLDGAGRYPRVVLIGGEAIDNRIWERLSNHRARRFYNVYGPTECTVDATICAVEDSDSPALGRPLPNVKIYLLDEQGSPVPPGVVGEICIGGTGVARGYLQNPELTAERFTPDPFSIEAGARLYRSGDFGRHLAGGRIEYRGRRDDQVKIRGSRVEPVEVEETLCAHPSVERAVVLPHKEGDGETSLVAYVVCRRSQRLTVDALREHVRGHLPDFMVPARFVRVEAIPLTGNGKVDRRLLRSAPDDGFEEQEVEEPLQTLTEELVAGVWQEVLQQPVHSRQANFFDLGGYSLLALRITARLRQELSVSVPVRALFNKPTVAALSSELDVILGASGNKALALERGRRDGMQPLSLGQQRLWFLAQLMPNDTSYNILLALRLNGDLRVPELSRSLSAILKRHETLRSTFVEEDGVPKVSITDESGVGLPLIDLSGIGREEALREAHARAREESGVPFNLGEGPLLRLLLLKLDADEHVLLLTTHHIVFDGSSVQLFLDELAALYSSEVTGQPAKLLELPIQYSDYARWLETQLDGGQFVAQLDYWRKQLKGAPTRLPLPYDYPETGAARESRTSKRVLLPGELAASLRDICRREEVTAYHIFLTAFVACVRRWAGHSDIVVTSPSSMRGRAEVEPLIGFFINNLVLRVRAPLEPTYRTLLGTVKDVVLNALTNQDVPFDKLLESAGVERKPGQTPFDQLRFDLQAHSEQTRQMPGLSLTLETSEAFEVRYDLFLQVRETGGSFSVALGYDARRFLPQTVGGLLDAFVNDVARLADNPDSLLSPAPSVEAAKDNLESERQSSKRSKLDKLLGVRPKPVRLDEGDLVAETFLDAQKSWPLVITPRRPDVKLAKWVEANLQLVEQRLLRHGAILFRGFNLRELAGFEGFVAAFNQELLEYRERSTPRTQVRGNIYTSTEYSADQSIPLHSENSYTHTWPMKIWFCCLRPAETGGGTLVADNRRVLERIDPALRERMTRESVMYVRNYHPRIDLPWEEVFQTTQRSKVEEYCREHSMTCEWLDGGQLRTTQISQAVARHRRTGEWVWFNQAHLFHLTNLPPAIRETLRESLAERDLPRNTFYGDGSPIEAEALRNISEAYSESSVAVDWQAGDVLMLDNMLASHGREPYAGTRKVVVAMAEPCTSNQSL
jgi:amino acid adenylation domain-containing protein